LSTWPAATDTIAMPGLRPPSDDSDRQFGSSAARESEPRLSSDDPMLSKSKRRSLNEAPNALNGQLQAALERQRTTSDDLQNVRYSAEIATLFLDRDFNIRFFTPATRSLFDVAPSDIGRPLAELTSLSADTQLLTDASEVIAGGRPVEREIEGLGGAWHKRRIMPYRTHDDKTEGVVITFEDVTQRRRISEALTAAKRQAELASAAKSRFLAAASHDLRQPLQSLALLQGLLAKRVADEKGLKLVGQIDEALDAMTGMLNALLDINQIEVGAVQAHIVDFPIARLLDPLRDELTYHAQAAGLTMRVAPSTLSVRSDPRLLEQMIRNLASNALKYTRRGSVLIGCRRQAATLRIDMCDTGSGIPESELQAIFDEYHQLDNPARQRSRGLGLGLSIVKRLGELLNHPIRVRSRRGKGSVFSIVVPRGGSDDAAEDGAALLNPPLQAAVAIAPSTPRSRILVIEDDPEIRTHLAMFLRDAGHEVASVVDGPAALDWMAAAPWAPELVLADYNLPNGMTGVEISRRLRRFLDRPFPCLILAGDISTQALRDISGHDCLQFNKPVKLADLTRALESLMKSAPPPVRARPAASEGERGIYIVDDDVRAAWRAVLEDDGRRVRDFASCEALLSDFRPDLASVLLTDAYLPGMQGLDLLRKLRSDRCDVPVVMITGDSDVGMAVEALRAGAADFIEKPVGRDELLGSLERAIGLSCDAGKAQGYRDSAARRLASLTPRQREVMRRVLEGHPSKNIAADLRISQRTVENHRASRLRRGLIGRRRREADVRRRRSMNPMSEPAREMRLRGRRRDDRTRARSRALA